MKKQLNVNAIRSELSHGSAFFPGYKGGSSPAPLAPKPEKPSMTESSGTPVPVGVPEPVRVPVPPPVPLIPKVRRPIRQRQPFDIYEDQYGRLKKIAETEKKFVNGRGMSQMVREAIDMYLQKESSPRK